MVRRYPRAEPLSDEDGEQARRDQRGRGGEEHADAAGARCGGERERRQLRLVAELGQEHAREHQGIGLHGVLLCHTRGRRMTNRAPPPACRSTVSVPPRAVTIERAIARPSPAPPMLPARAASRRTNGSKIRSASASGTPGPVSSTTSSTVSRSCTTEISTLPPRGVYLIAFSTRLSAA